MTSVTVYNLNSDIYYEPYQSMISVALPQWTHTYEDQCGSFYPLEISFLGNGTLITESNKDNAKSFNQASSTFSVFTSDSTIIGTYVI